MPPWQDKTEGKRKVKEKIHRISREENKSIIIIEQKSEQETTEI